MNEQIRARIILAIKNARTPWEAHREGLISVLGSPSSCVETQRQIILDAVTKALDEVITGPDLWPEETTKETTHVTKKETPDNPWA
jgi:hypothetical protein